MPNYLLKRALNGEENETVFKRVVTNLLTVTFVPRQIDLGIDAYCDVLAEAGSQGKTGVDSTAVQIKAHIVASECHMGLREAGLQLKGVQRLCTGFFDYCVGRFGVDVVEDGHYGSELRAGERE